MRRLPAPRRLLIGAGGLGALLLASTAAFGLPWDIDMVDSQAIKAYRSVMKPLPEGVVSQPNLLSPKPYVTHHKLTDPEVALMQNPFPDDQAHQEKGRQMFGITCSPCHGDGVNLGVVSRPGFQAAVLAGPTGISRSKTDGWIYFTIRDGSLSTIMLPYGYMLTEEEMWSVVRYVRTLDNAAFVPPAPPAAPAGSPP